MAFKSKYLYLIKSDLVEHILFIILAILSIFYYQERLFADAGYYVLRLINEQQFIVEHSRFVLALSQLLPFMALSIGLSLKIILISYSLGHILFFYLIYVLSKSIYHFKHAALTILLLQTLSLSSGFFVPMFELYYCGGLLVLFYAILSGSENRWKFALLLPLSVLILTGHPYATALILFVLALHALKNFKSYWPGYLVFLAIILFVYFFKTQSATEYQIAKTNALLNNYHFANYDSAYLKALLAYLIKDYTSLIVLFSITCIILLSSRAYLTLVLLVLSFISLLVLINLSSYGFEHTRYQEQVYYPLGFVVSLAFMAAISNLKKHKAIKLGTYAAIIIISIGIGRIYIASTSFTERLTEMTEYISKAKTIPGTKFIVLNKELNSDPNWSYSIESLLISTCQENNISVSLSTDADYYYNQNDSIKDDHYLFRKWEMYSIQSLNHKYFQLENEPYQILSLRAK